MKVKQREKVSGDHLTSSARLLLSTRIIPSDDLSIVNKKFAILPWQYSHNYLVVYFNSIRVNFLAEVLTWNENQ